MVDDLESTTGLGWCLGLVVWDSGGAPKNPTPFHKGIPTESKPPNAPNHQPKPLADGSEMFGADDAAYFEDPKVIVISIAGIHK